MRMARLTVLALLALGIVGLGLGTAAFKAEPKYAIKDVMKEAMKGGLCKKVADGKADEAEKKKLVDLFTALSENKPPKGDAADWKTRTEALVKAAKACAAGDKDGPAALKKAANCKGCHDLHKGG
jgi:hypothetical protein